MVVRAGGTNRIGEAIDGVQHAVAGGTDGRPAPPGSTGNMPWQRQLDLGLHWTPAFADHKLGLNLDVFNVTNEQAELSINPHYYQDATGSPNPLYRTPLYLQDPRYVRFSITYDY